MKSQQSQLLIGVGLMLILSAIMLPMATALDDSDADYIVKQYSAFDIKRPCINNGSWCGDTTQCNITIASIQDLGGIIVNNQNMTNMGSYFNYTVSNTPNLGFYQVNIVCVDGGATGSEIFYYKITSTGALNPSYTFLMLAVAVILILALALISKNEYIAFIAGSLSLLWGVYIIIYGFNGMADIYTRSIGYVALGIGLLYCVGSAWTLVANAGATGMEEVEEIVSE